MSTKDTKNTKNTNDEKIAEANRRIIRKLNEEGASAAFKELMKHPITGAPMDYAESRMYFG